MGIPTLVIAVLPRLPWKRYILVVGASHSRLHLSSCTLEKRKDGQPRAPSGHCVPYTTYTYIAPKIIAPSPKVIYLPLRDMQNLPLTHYSCLYFRSCCI
jgi:hypothetical protein